MASNAEDSWNVVIIGAVVFLVSSYLLVIRPFVGSEMPQALSILEWSMVVVAFAIVGWLAYRYLKTRSSGLGLGDWKVLGDDVRRETAELGAASEAVREFVEQGRKEGLILLVASVLEKNTVDAESSKRVIALIIDYREEEPRLSTVRSEARRKEKAIAERKLLVQDLLRLCSSIVGGADHPIEDTNFTLKPGGGSEVGDR